MRYHFKYLWFRDQTEEVVFINHHAVRLRAGLMLLLPVYMITVLLTTVNAPTWTVFTNGPMEETFELTEDLRVIFTVQAYKTAFDYTVPTWVLFYGLFEMLSGMFIKTAYLSPTVHLATYLTRNIPPKWEPLKPKRFAWIIGALLISSCILFFNPDSFARFVNSIFGETLLPTTSNWMPYFIPLLVWVCFGLMWLEATLGLCLGCKLHWLLAKLGIFKRHCYDCMNVDFAEKAWIEERKRLEAELEQAQQK